MTDKRKDFLEHRVTGIVTDAAMDFVAETVELYMIGSGRSVEDISFSLSSLAAAVSNLVMYEMMGEPEEGNTEFLKSYKEFKEDYVDSLKIRLDEATREILRNGGGLTDEEVKEMYKSEDEQLINTLKGAKKFEA
jgi:hypothetical protein